MQAKTKIEEGNLGNATYFALKVTHEGVTRTFRISAYEYGEDGTEDKKQTEQLLQTLVGRLTEVS